MVPRTPVPAVAVWPGWDFLECATMAVTEKTRTGCADCPPTKREFIDVLQGLLQEGKIEDSGHTRPCHTCGAPQTVWKLKKEKMQ